MERRDLLIAAIGGVVVFVILASATAAALYYKGGSLLVNMEKGTIQFTSRRDPLEELIRGSCQNYKVEDPIKVCENRMILGPSQKLIELDDSSSLAAHGLIHGGDWGQVSEDLFHKFRKNYAAIIRIGEKCKDSFVVENVTVGSGAPYSNTLVLNKYGSLQKSYFVTEPCVLTIRGKNEKLRIGGFGDLRGIKRKNHAEAVEISNHDFDKLVGTSYLIIGTVPGLVECGSDQ